MNQYQIDLSLTATRMCSFFKLQHYHVPHTAVLAALVEATGSPQPLQSKSDGVPAIPTATKPESEPTPELGIWQTWTVEAIYLENNQLFGDYYRGRTPLEAAINAMVERLTSGDEMGICSVRDASGAMRLAPTFLTEIQLYANGDALTALMKCVMELSLSTSFSTSNEGLVAARSLLYRACGSGALGVIRDWDNEDSDPYDHLTDGFQLTKAAAEVAKEPSGEVDATVPSKSLRLLCEAVEQHYGGAPTLENFDEALATQLYQIRATCKYFETLINRPDSIFGRDYYN